MGGGFAELAESRRSWLGYTGEPVAAKVIEDLVALAGSAPSETNLQPWRFIAALGAGSCERLSPAFLPPNRPKLRAVPLGGGHGDPHRPPPGGVGGAPSATPGRRAGPIPRHRKAW